MSTTRAEGLYMHAILLSRLSAPERLTRGASLGAHVSVERLGDDIVSRRMSRLFRAHAGLMAADLGAGPPQAVQNFKCLTQG